MRRLLIFVGVVLATGFALPAMANPPEDQVLVVNVSDDICIGDSVHVEIQFPSPGIARIFGGILLGFIPIEKGVPVLFAVVIPGPVMSLPEEPQDVVKAKHRGVVVDRNRFRMIAD